MNFTNREKELLLSNAAVFSRIKLYGEDNTVLHVFNEDDYLIDWDYEDYRYVPDQGFIGQFVERLLDGHFMNIPDDISLENKEIEMEIAVKDPELEEQVYHSYGRFIITKIEKEDASGSYKFEASDYTKKFNAAYESSVNYPCLAIELLNDAVNKAEVYLEGDDTCIAYAVTENGLSAGNYCFAAYVGDTLTYFNFTTEKDLSYRDSLMLVASKGKVIQRVVNEDYSVTETEIVYASSTTQVGTLLSNEELSYVDFINNNFVIEDNQFVENNSCREVVSAIAKLGYTWARVGTDNKLYLDFVKKSEEDVDSYDEIDTDKYYEATITGDTIKPINKVLLGMSNVEGENIYSEQSADRIRLDKMYGETSQDTYTGKNLLNLSTKVSNLNVSVTGDTDFVTINGTSNGDGKIDIGTSNLPAGTYTMMAEYLSGTISSPEYITAWIYYKGTWDRPTTADIGINGGGIKQHAVTFTITGSETKNVCFGLYLTNGRKFSNVKIRISIVAGSTADYNYEPYVGGVASPNPTYPQGVKTITGGNTVSITGKSILGQGYTFIDGSNTNAVALAPGSTSSRSGMTLVRNEDQSVSVSGTTTGDPAQVVYGIGRIGNSGWSGYNNAYILPAGTYKVVWEFSNSSNVSIAIWKYDKYSNYIGAQSIKNISDTNTSGVSTLTVDGQTVTALGLNSGQSNEITPVTVKLMVVKNDVTDYTYEPYKTTEYELDFGKNLFDKSYVNASWLSGTSAEELSDGAKITSVGAGSYKFATIPIPNSNYLLGKKVTVYADTVRSGNNESGLNLYFINTTNKTLITGIANSGSRSTSNRLITQIPTTYPTNANAIALILYSSFTTNGSIGDYVEYHNLQLEVGEKNTSYAPYIVSKNLFNKNNVFAGYLSDAGNLISNANFSTSNFINVKGVSKITISGSSGSSENVCFYTETKTFVSFVTTGTNTTMTIDVPNNAYYLRATIKNTNLDTYQIEQGSVATYYEPYDKHIELCKIGNYQDYITKNTGANIFIPTMTNNGASLLQASCTAKMVDDEYVLNATGTDMYVGGALNAGTAYADRFGVLYPIGNATKIYLYLTNTTFTKNYVQWWDDDKVSLGFSAITSSNGNTSIKSGAKYFSIRFGYGSATSGTTYKTRVMVSYSPITKYEPYGKDEWYEYHDFDVVDLSTLNWTSYGSYARTQDLTGRIKYVPNNTTLGVCVASNYRNHTGSGMSGSSANGCICIDTNAIATNPATNQKGSFYFLLDAPKVKKITYQPLIDQLNAIESNAQTYGGKTYITSSGVEVNPKVDITVTDLEQVETSYTNNTDYEVNGHEYEESELKIYDNPLTHSEELRRIAINGAEKLYGLTYTPMTINSIGHPWLEGDDFVKLTNLEENDLYFYPFDRKMSYKGYITTDLSATAENQVKEKYENPNNILNRLNHTEIDVDKANQRIDLIAEQTSGNTQNITNMQLDINGINQSVQHIEDTEIAGLQSQISTVNQTMNAITNMFQISGGINVIRNSAFLLQDAVWEFTDNGTNPYYTPLGSSYNVALSGTTTSVAEIKLRSVKVKSKSENVTNLILGTKYTFNFYHKQDNNMTTTIKMYSTENNNVKAFDDIVITGQQGFRNYEVSFTPTTYANYTIEIIVTSTASVGYAYIYDMMLNSGDKQSWQPASDEIYSTTLQMSRLGLQVYSVGDGTITILGSDGMATYETTDGKTLGRLVSLRNIDGDRTRVITTQAVYLTKDITQENDNKWVETIVTISGSPYKVEYVESGE